MVKPEATRAVVEAVSIPTIGIGAGGDCDGQILVFTDVLGLTPGYVPGFVEKFADTGTLVRERRFPTE